MKTKKIFFLCFMVAFMLPFFSKAQGIASNNPPTLGQKPVWKNVKLNGTQSNVISGVEFYFQVSECPSSGKVLFAKVVNTNAYAVNISYQVSPDAPVEHILVPASLTVEGSCVLMDGNFSKLVIILPENAETKKKSPNYFLTHITVAKN